MNRIKKIALFVILISIILSYQFVCASDIQMVELTEEYKEWLQLPKEEQKKLLTPRMYNISKTTSKLSNPIYLAYSLRSSLDSLYNLNKLIPENVMVRNQQQTGACWAFASLASLETNLALNNYNRGILAKTYDFSERHMIYSTTRAFANNQINEYGFNKDISSGTLEMSLAYLTNGMGAIDEKEMPFENNENIININEIQNKTVVTQVKDVIKFPSYATNEVTTEVKNRIKEHIYKYGSIAASIHGAQINSEYYNNVTGAIYCDDVGKCKIDHGVSIIGWDDNYSIENFNSTHRPIKNGAWIIKNSWGTDVGDNGLMYISYEDVNIYYNLLGIVKANDYIDYDDIYQYDYLGGAVQLSYRGDTAYLATIFDKKKPINEKEYVTSIAISVPETSKYTVYINTKGSDLEQSSLQKVELKSGESQTCDAGYHTLEFLNPIEIESSTFAIVVKVEKMSSTTSTFFNVEANILDTAYEGTKIEQGKCFATTEEGLNKNEWADLSKFSGQYPLANGEIITINGCDNTIKAFTVSEIIDDSLKDIEIVTQPTKKNYFVGENFNKAGMVVKANYNNGRSNIIVGYDIENGTDLQENQDSVIIVYENKKVKQPITVVKNTVESLTVKNPPTKTIYKAGRSFVPDGMIVEATYKDGTKKIITDYKIEDGYNLKNGQTTVTIGYGEKEVKQPITVEPNLLVRIEIEKAPNKTEYIAGQDFDKTGMKIIAIYEDGLEEELLNYTVEGGENLKAEQTYVTIKFEDRTKTQAIKVVEKTIVSISIKHKPNKLTYIMNKEILDLAGGQIEAIYNDGDKEEVSMADEQVKVTGFSNQTKGDITLTVTYKTKATTFTVKIKEEEIENSNFSNAESDVKEIKAYWYTDEAKQKYMLINVEVNNIIRNMNNDSYEYYYYLSTSQAETDITDWVKVVEEQNSNNKIGFTINTKDISNINELSNSNVLYLYIKEVAIKGGSQRAIVSNSMLLEGNSNIEIYIDDVKQEIKVPDDNKGEKPEEKPKDNTTSENKLPNAGIKITIIISIIVISIIGICGYIKYKQMKEI